MGLYALGRDWTAKASQYLPASARSALLANQRIFIEFLEYGGAEGLRAEALHLGIRGKATKDNPSPANPDLAEALAKKYVELKAAQAQAEPQYRPHQIWQDLLDRDWTQGRIAAASCRYEDFDLFLRNFFRNGGVSGVWGSGDMFQAFIDMSEWDDLARLALFIRQLKAWRRSVPYASLDEIDHPAVGNPWGYDVEGRLVIEPEFEYHELAGRMRTLLEPKADPVIVEIGGGFGGFAAQVLRQIPGARYIGFDLPENVIIQSYHATRCFPHKSVRVDDLSNVGAPDLVSILPNWRLADVQTQNVDLLVNVRSFAEMSAETLDSYFQHIRRIRPTWIYHENVAGGRKDQTHAIGVADYPALPEYRLVASNESRWPRYDRDSAYPCREHLLLRKDAA